MSTEISTEIKENESKVIEFASAIVVTSEETKANAMEFVKVIRNTRDKVVGYWSEPKQSAHKSWKAIVAKEKEMLDRLDEAEKLVKGKLNDYVRAQERVLEAQQSKLAETRRLEAEKLLAEAVEMEKTGDVIGSAIAMQVAERLDSNNVAFEKPSNTKVVFSAVVENESIVPAYLDGMCLRPVDAKACLAYYKQFGKAPAGIAIKQETEIMVRR
jgi:hypothetical protein